MIVTYLIKRNETQHELPLSSLTFSMKMTLNVALFCYSLLQDHFQANRKTISYVNTQFHMFIYFTSGYCMHFYNEVDVYTPSNSITKHLLG